MISARAGRPVHGVLAVDAACYGGSLVPGEPRMTAACQHIVLACHAAGAPKHVKLT